MQAWQIQQHGAPDIALRLVEIDIPQPGPAQLRVRVEAAAIGLPDALMCQGTYPLTPPLPFVAGQEICGTVEAVGTSVDGSLVGTRMMGVTNFFNGQGGFAESAIVAVDNAFRVPESMNTLDAAAFRIGFSTAWIGLVRRGNLTSDETVVVLGASGGTGAAAVQLARALGARVIAVASGARKCQFASDLGADTVVDRLAADVRAEIMRFTEGRGADVVYDPVGGDAAASASRALAAGGRFLAVGFASGSWADIATANLVQRNASLVGVHAGGLSRGDNERDHQSLVALAPAHRLGGFTTAVPFDKLPQAVSRINDGTVIGKLAMVVGNTS